MRVRIFAGLILLLAGPAVAQQSRNRAAVDEKDILARCRVSMVRVVTYGVDGASLRMGSGFLVRKNRIATNFHVLAGGASAFVEFDDGAAAMITAVVAADGSEDLAVVEAATGNRPLLAFGDEFRLEEDEMLYAIGEPGDSPVRLIRGRFWSFLEQGIKLVTIRAPLVPGFSGGALVNNKGQVVGVTTGNFYGSRGAAVGISHLKSLLRPFQAIRVPLTSLAADFETLP